MLQLFKHNFSFLGPVAAPVPQQLDRVLGERGPGPILPPKKLADFKQLEDRTTSEAHVSNECTLISARGSQRPGRRL